MSSASVTKRLFRFRNKARLFTERRCFGCILPGWGDTARCRGGLSIRVKAWGSPNINHCDSGCCEYLGLRTDSSSYGRTKIQTEVGSQFRIDRVSATCCAMWSPATAGSSCARPCPEAASRLAADFPAQCSGQIGSLPNDTGWSSCSTRTCASSPQVR